jgi:hypothetical protein
MCDAPAALGRGRRRHAAGCGWVGARGGRRPRARATLGRRWAGSRRRHPSLRLVWGPRSRPGPGWAPTRSRAVGARIRPGGGAAERRAHHNTTVVARGDARRRGREARSRGPAGWSPARPTPGLRCEPGLGVVDVDRLRVAGATDPRSAVRGRQREPEAAATWSVALSSALTRGRAARPETRARLWFAVRPRNHPRRASCGARSGDVSVADSACGAPRRTPRAPHDACARGCGGAPAGASSRRGRIRKDAGGDPPSRPPERGSWPQPVAAATTHGALG